MMMVWNDPKPSLSHRRGKNSFYPTKWSTIEAYLHGFSSCEAGLASSWWPHNCRAHMTWSYFGCETLTYLVWPFNVKYHLTAWNCSNMNVLPRWRRAGFTFDTITCLLSPQYASVSCPACLGIPALLPVLPSWVFWPLVGWTLSYIMPAPLGLLNIPGRLGVLNWVSKTAQIGMCPLQLTNLIRTFICSFLSPHGSLSTKGSDKNLLYILISSFR